MSRHLFTYGSLMFAPVWQQVVRGSYRAIPARLPGFARFAVRNETYPGLVAQAGAVVDGIVYLDIAAQDWIALDRFEGSDYRRQTVEVQCNDAGVLAVDTYIYIRPAALTTQPWRADDFDMARFLSRYCRS